MTTRDHPHDRPATGPADRRRRRRRGPDGGRVLAPAAHRTVERDGQGGWTPLHLAVAEGQADIVAAAGRRRRGPRPPRPSTPGRRCTWPWSTAPTSCRCCSSSAPSSTRRAPPTSAARRARRALDARRRARRDHGPGVDLLSWAALGGAAAAVRLLLDRGADADAGALHAAAAGGQLELVRLLLDAGADVDRRDPDTGRAPLHAAVAAGAGRDVAGVVRALLAAGADVNATTTTGRAPWTSAGWPPPATGGATRAGRPRNDALADLLVSRGATD